MRDSEIEWRPDFIETPSLVERLRERAENFRSAALIGYGALMAHNSDGELDQVIKAGQSILWPMPIMASRPSTTDQ